MKPAPLTSSAKHKIYELRQYYEVGNHDYACKDYFTARNLKSAEQTARKWLANDWDEEVAQNWSLKQSQVEDAEGRSLTATLAEVEDLYTHLGLEEARAPVRVAFRRGKVQGVVGSKKYSLLDYDAVEAREISANTIMKTAKLKKLNTQTRVKRKPRMGEQYYSEILKGSLRWLVVGMHPRPCAVTYIGDDLGWAGFTLFPFET